MQNNNLMFLSNVLLFEREKKTIERPWETHILVNLCEHCSVSSVHLFSGEGFTFGFLSLDSKKYTVQALII